eukprot:3926134-Amphidinium_carterae.6
MGFNNLSINHCQTWLPGRGRWVFPGTMPMPAALAASGKVLVRMCWHSAADAAFWQSWLVMLRREGQTHHEGQGLHHMHACIANAAWQDLDFIGVQESYLGNFA